MAGTGDGSPFKYWSNTFPVSKLHYCIRALEKKNTNTHNLSIQLNPSMTLKTVTQAHVGEQYISGEEAFTYIAFIWEVLLDVSMSW